MSVGVEPWIARFGAGQAESWRRGSSFDQHFFIYYSTIRLRSSLLPIRQLPRSPRRRWQANSDHLGDVRRERFIFSSRGAPEGTRGEGEGGRGKVGGAGGRKGANVCGVWEDSMQLRREVVADALNPAVTSPASVANLPTRTVRTPRSRHSSSPTGPTKPRSGSAKKPSTSSSPTSSIVTPPRRSSAPLSPHAALCRAPGSSAAGVPCIALRWRR